MSIWAAANAAIIAAFADPELLTYICVGCPAVSVRAVRSDEGIDGGGRRIMYEIADSEGLPANPTKRDTFVHRGRLWGVDSIKRRDDLGAWQLDVVDNGSAS